MNKQFKLNEFQLSTEMNFLFHIISDSEDSKKFSGNTIDWELFIELARHHRVYPNIYKRLKELSITWIPHQVIQQLNKDYQRNTYRMLYLSSEMEQLARRFSNRKIKAIFLKGPVLANDLYGDVSLRTSADLDVLIPIEKLDVVHHLLTENGYVKDEYIHTILGDWKWRHHHFTYYHSDKKIKIEIHWRLNPGPAKEPRFNELWGRKRISRITTTPIYILGKEDLFLFLILHGARHGWSRIRWLVDIKQLLNKEPDWTETVKTLKSFHATRITGQALILLSEYLGSTIPDEVFSLTESEKAKRLAQTTLYYFQNMINLHTEPLLKEVSEYHRRYLSSLMPFQQRFLFFMSFLYPYPEDTEILTLPKKFHFLYFPLRPFLWAWRKTMKEVPEGVKR